MFDVKCATLCLLITYHWHGSWAVSTWPSGRPGIAAEVNGSPTDARLNIPVVKRSSNQADLANELLLPLRADVVVGDSREKLGEFLAVGLFEPTKREYANRPSEKYVKPMIRDLGSGRMMIESSLDRAGYGDKSAEWVADGKSKMRSERTGKDEEDGGEWLKGGVESWISGKHVVPMSQLIGGKNHATVITPRQVPAGRWLRYEDTGFTSAGRRRKRSHDETRTWNSWAKSAGEKPGENVGNGVGIDEGTIDDPAIDSTGVFDIRRIRDEASIVLSRSWLEASLGDTGRIDSSKLKARKRRENAGKTMADYDIRGMPNRSSSLSTSKFLEHATLHGNRNKPSTTGSGITSSLNVAKLLDSSRLHQQSRNTKPRRTIVKHLRRKINRQTRSYEKSRMSLGMKEVYRPEIIHFKPTYPGKTITGDPRNRQQSNHRKYDHVPPNANANQLRFIPYYNNYAKNQKTSGSQKSTDNELGDIVVLSGPGELTLKNIVNLPSFNQGQVDHLSESLRSVFDKRFSGKRRNELPNVRAILPKQVYVAPPRLIYDTKILPAPVSFDMFFQNSGNSPNDAITDLKESKNAESPSSSVSEGEKTTENIDAGNTTPVTEDPENSVTTSVNFVTPLPPSTDQVSFRANQPKIPPGPTIVSDEIYQVRGPEEMENSSRARVHETTQRDKDEPRINQKSPSETGVKDHSSNVRSSYGNSVNTYPKSRNRSESGNVNHSTVIEAINDEYTNERGTGFHDGSNSESDVRTRTSQMPNGQRDRNYNRGQNKWRDRSENDHARYDAKYSFGYIVNDNETRNDFGHQEKRDEGITTGRYHVKLPDGRTQRVNYQVDENGYHAAVSYLTR